MKLDYTLIGSIPSMECFRDNLPDIIAEYQTGKPDTSGLEIARDEGKLTEYLDNLRSQPSVIERMSKGVVIEMCAQHFYGINTDECDSIAAVIDAIQSAEQNLEF
jgi:hypothetical protein